MSIAENLQIIKAAIEKAAKVHGYQPAQIVAVSKKQPLEKISEALNAGVRVFGENRVQEAKERWQDLKAQHPDLVLHLVGPLQTNKAKEAVQLFDVIETIDREKLVDVLADEMKKQNKMIPCFIQVNTGDEEQKSGVAPDDVKALLTYCIKAGVNIQGLMCIPPQDDPPALHFALLKKIAAAQDLKFLSMGMSGDYEKAVALGATHVRLGTALFGKRLT